MRTALTLLLAVCAVQSATIHGIVVEQQTGRAVARALVAVHPVAGGSGVTKAVRCDRNGVFELTSLPAGAYVVTISRRGFAPVEYGQKRWKGAGSLVNVPENGEAELRIALPHFGAIAGRISDEADVGMPDHTVVAYRNTRPPQMAGKAVTDDRGLYRIHDLEPGVYVVRSAAKEYDDGGYLPTFYNNTPTVDRARRVEVLLDRDTPDINVRPFPGQLYLIGGQVSGPGIPPVSVTVTLTSDMGAETSTSDNTGRFKFNPVAPGKYELFAEWGDGLASWQAFELIDRDRTDVRASLVSLPAVSFLVADTNGARLDPAEVQVLARRKELAGPGTPRYLRLTNGRAPLTPGRWEFALAPNAGQYVAGFSGPNTEIPAGRWTDGWNTVTIGGASEATVTFIVSTSPGSLRGIVSDARREPVAGAPVYLEPYDAEARLRLGEPRVTRTDIRGTYRFAGLPPGTYRIVSTLGEPAYDDAPMVRVEERRETARDLELQ
jgi:hypothetical protein